MRFIDVSNYQGTPNWKVVAKQGRIVGALVKAAEGTHFVDPSFARNRAQAAAAGIHVGAYYFARPDHDDPVAAARFFAKVVGKVRGGELRPMLDYEVPTKLTTAQMVRWVHNFNQEVKRLTGVLPMFYSYSSLIRALKLSNPLGDGLVVADYGRNTGREYPFVVPKPWKRAVMHQYSSVGSVPGIKGHVDLDDAARLSPLLAHPVIGNLLRPLAAIRRRF